MSYKRKIQVPEGEIDVTFIPNDGEQASGEKEKTIIKKPTGNKSSGLSFFWVISYIAFLLFCYFLASKGSFENLFK